MIKKILGVALLCGLQGGMLLGMQRISRDAWPPTVNEISRADWPDKSCLIRQLELENGEEFCACIQKNYTVTLYAKRPDRCISFDPGGIIGDELESSSFDLQALLIEVKKMNSKESGTHNIADEANTLLESISLQDMFDPEYRGCALNQKKVRQYWDMPISIMYKGVSVSYNRRLLDLGTVGILPSLIDRIKM